MNPSPTNSKIDGLRRWREADRELAAAFVRRLQAALSREGAMSNRPSWVNPEEEEAGEVDVEVRALALARASSSPSEAQEQSELGAQAAAAQGGAAAAAGAAAQGGAAEAEAEAEAEAAALANNSALEDDQMELEDEGDAMEQEEAGDAAAAAAAFSPDHGPQTIVDDQGFQEGEEEIGYEEEGDRVAAAAAAAPFLQQLPLEGVFGGGGSACRNRGDGGRVPSPRPLLFSTGAGLGAPPLGGAAAWLAQGQVSSPFSGPRGTHWKRGVKRPREEASRGFANGLEGNQFEPAPAAALPLRAPQIPALPPPALAPEEPPMEPSAFGLGRRMRLVLLGNRGPN